MKYSVQARPFFPYCGFIWISFGNLVTKIAAVDVTASCFEKQLDRTQIFE